MTAPVWITNAGFLFTATELVSVSQQLQASGDNVQYTAISGKLPDGLNITTGGLIYGSADPVLADTPFRFVIRAKNTDGVMDRTFSISVLGPDIPIWNTPSGYLSVGVNDEPYCLNGQRIQLQLAADAVQAPSGSKIRYYIGDGDGTLPAGVTLDQAGVLTGYVRENLTFDGRGSARGGYDDEAYDKYSYDHVSSTSTVIQITSVPRIFQFRVTATDGVTSEKRLFKLLVVNPDMLRTDTSLLPIDINALSLDTLASSVGYLQAPQWLINTDLGVIRASNNQDLEVAAYDPNPLLGPIFYFTTGTTEETRLPQGLTLDPELGHIYGFVPYQPAYTKYHQLTVSAVKVDLKTGSLATATTVFSLAVKGEVESSIEWISESDLGSIEIGALSELAVVAKQTASGYNIKYQILSGELPDGLVLERDGSLSGRVPYSSTTGTYTFMVQASDVYELSSVERQFQVSTYQTRSTEYTEIYMRPFMSTDKRRAYSEFINDDFVFEPALIYRFFDNNFGVQYQIKMILEFGIEKVNLDDYVPALRENFYRKRLYFGDIKVALAKDQTGEIIYEIVYVDVVDDLVNNQGQSVSPVIYSNNNIYYPGSIDNMRRQLKLLVLQDYTYIEVNEYLEPKFMRTPQLNDYRPPGYMRVIPLCYALPGQGKKIVSRIKLSGFDFKQLDFEVDRLIIQSSTDSTTAKYLLLERQSMGDQIATDDFLYGPESWVRLDDENHIPLIREP